MKKKSEVHKSGIDWEAIYEELTQAETRVTAHEMSEEWVQQIWARRAADLAQADDQAGEENLVELLLVKLGSETYAINVHYVFDIRMAKKITPVPRVPQWVSGIVNVRGRIISAIDLGRFLGLSGVEVNEKENGALHKVGADKAGQEKGGQEAKALVLIETPQMEVVLVVDEVLAVNAFPESQIQSPSGTIRGLNPDYVSGIANLGSGVETLFIILNLETILNDRKLVIQEEIL